MKKINLQNISEFLTKQVENQRSHRFQINDFDESEIFKALKLCYKAEVEKRGIVFMDDNATNSRISQAAKWLCHESKPGLMLFGRVGSGKSTLGKAIVQLIQMLYGDYRLGNERIYFVVGSAMNLNSAAANKDMDEFNKFKMSKYLFLDDIGCEPSPIVRSWGNELSPMMDLIYYRYDNLRPTIITSNLTLSQMRQFYGERVGDRMFEMFNGIEFTQTMSYRK